MSRDISLSERSSILETHTRDVGQTAGKVIQSEYHLVLDQARGNRSTRVVVTRSIKSRGYAVLNPVHTIRSLKVGAQGGTTWGDRETRSAAKITRGIDRFVCAMNIEGIDVGPFSCNRVRRGSGSRIGTWGRPMDHGTA